MNLRRLAGQELSDLQPLFLAAFGHALSPRLLAWKYAAGQGESWLAESADGQPALHCGLLFRNIRLAGETHRAAQLTDLAALPKMSGLTRNNSPFFHLMRHLLHTLPRPDNPAGLAFGFPSDRAMRLGEHLGVYRAVDQLVDLVFTPLRPLRLGLRCRVLEQLPEERITERLWASMAKSLPELAVGVRDPHWLHWRFAAHPENRYRFIALQGALSRRTLGLAILRPGNDITTLTDLLAPADALPDMLNALSAWLPQAGCRELHFSLTSRPSLPLAALASRCTPSEIRIMANPLSPTALLDRLHNAWWLTSGDTDYR